MYTGAVCDEESASIFLSSCAFVVALALALVLNPLFNFCDDIMV